MILFNLTFHSIIHYFSLLMNLIIRTLILNKNNSYLLLSICFLTGSIFWFFPVPDTIPIEGWHAFAVFISVILSFILRPFSMGPMVIFGLMTLMLTNTLTIEEALSGYGNSTVWLVVAAFLIAGAVIKTGFGNRIALMLVKKFGKSILGLGYSITAAELILGPVVPSNTARGGGILAPITRSLAEALDSYPEENPDRAGSYLTTLGAHANLITAAMFLTGMAANPVLAESAKIVFGIEFTWGMWALGAIVPGLLALAMLPPFIKQLTKPELDDTKAAQEKAESNLKEMGDWKKGELIMGAIFAILLILWSTKALHGMGTTLVAWIGVTLLLLTRTQDWDEMAQNSKAWDTLIWLGGLLTMANTLKTHGMVDWFAGVMQVMLSDMQGLTIVILMGLIYFYSMYAFSMLTAHIFALATAFFTVALGVGAPALLIIAVLAYFSNLCACTTNYSTGPVIIYFGLGYVKPPRWFSIGFLVSLFHISIWLTVGLAWWKLLGWW